MPPPTTSHVGLLLPLSVIILFSCSGIYWIASIPLATQEALRLERTADWSVQAPQLTARSTTARHEMLQQQIQHQWMDPQAKAALDASLLRSSSIPVPPRPIQQQQQQQQQLTQKQRQKLRKEAVQTDVNSNGASESTSASVDTNTNNNNNNNSDLVHVVFSTGCTALQDWQSIVFFYQAYQVGCHQHGTVTRIASGCTPDEAIVLEKFHNDYIASKLSFNFILHLTPDYSKIVPDLDYKYFNKPFGVRHWLEHKLGYNFADTNSLENENNVRNDDIVVICDPDQAIIRPFVRDYKDQNVLWYEGDNPPLYTRVQRGQPIAQEFGFGAHWLNRMNWTHVFGGNQELADASPASKLTESVVLKHFAVGPPYLAVTHDMFRIVQSWTNLVIPVHSLTKSILSEMYGYSVGAAHAGLPHQTARSFMVSDTQMRIGEGWPLIHNSPIDSPDPYNMPFTLHFCQRYFLGPYFFSKYQLPKEKQDERNFMSCQHPLLAEPPADLYKLYNSSTTIKGIVHEINDEKRRYEITFMLYHLIRIVNNGVQFIKEQRCDSSILNVNKTFYLTLNT